MSEFDKLDLADYTERVIRAVLHDMQMAQAQLDNNISLASDTQEGESEMSKEKRRVVVGYQTDGTPICRQLSAKDSYEMNDRIVQEYVNTGRIDEFYTGIRKNKTFADNAIKPTKFFKEYADNWFDTYIVSRKPSTVATYRKILKVLNKEFGDKPLSEIKTDDIQRFLNANKHLSKKTLKEQVARLKQIFDSAIEDGLIDHNPAKSRRIVIPSEKVTQRDAIPLDVMRIIISKSANLDEKDRRLLLLLVTTGGRRGEVLGLQWQDIDTEQNVIHIRRNVTHASGNVPIVGTTKTASGFRDVPYDPAIRKLLDPNGKQPDAFIFEGRSATEPMTMTMYNNTWHRIQEAIPELKAYSAHNFRHTYATLLSEYTDATPKTIQAIAGHSDIRTTMSIYEHARRENIDSANQAMHNILFGL